MKKMLLSVAVVGLVGFAGARPASAQTNPVLIKVPFAFIVGDHVLPAGSYRITPGAEDPSVLLVENTQHPTDAAFVVAQSAPNASVGDPRVQFKSVGGHMFLWQVEVPGDGAREVMVTRAAAERVLARLNLMPAEPAR